MVKNGLQNQALERGVFTYHKDKNFNLKATTDIALRSV